MIGWTKKVAPVAARMMTWEVTTAFDGTLTETELRKRFDEDFRDVFNAGFADGECAVFFWPLVSFNASDGRKHRYLVAVAEEPLENYRKTFDRCLPQQIVLYAVADKILRGECIAGLICADMSAAGSVNAAVEDCASSNGNLILVALWKNCLYILVFAKGRLCHWSEEFGYGDCFDERCQIRVERFKSFLKAAELFAGSCEFSEVRVGCDDLLNMGNLFEKAAKDSFWSGLDLDNCESMKPCEKRRWTICAAMLLMLGLALVFFCSDSWIGLYLRTFANERFDEFVDVAPVELSSPATRDLEMLAWAEGHRDLLPAKWFHGRDGIADGAGLFDKLRSRKACDSLDYKLLGIVGGRVALMESATGESKMLSVGDSLFRYRVKVIGKNEVLLRCGHKEVRYEVGTADVSQVGAR